MPSRKPNSAHSATPHTSTCTTTTGKNAHSCFVKFAHRLFRPTTVIKEPRKPNTIVRIARARSTAGKPVLTSLFTNAAMITVRTDSTRSKDSTPRNKICANHVYRSSNFATFTVNTCSRPEILLLPHRLNPPSIFAKFTIHPTSSASSSRSSSPSPSAPARPPTSCAWSLTSTSPIKPSSTTPRPPRTTVTNST